MARQLRIEFPGALYHVMSRGNERNPIFKQDADRILFIETLKDSVELAGVGVIAYILMDNHYHMILETPNANLSEFMRHFHVTYTVRFNKRHNRSGHLFQGRFKAVLIEEDPYLVVLSRYIHLNPIRREDWERKKWEEKWDYIRRYPWSSLPGYIEARKKENWIQYEKVLDYFTEGGKSSRIIYKRYLGEGLKKGLSNPFSDVKSQVILGREGFVEEMRKYFQGEVGAREVPALRSLKKVLAIEEVLREVAVYFHMEREKLISKRGGGARQIAMEMSYRYTKCNQEEIGRIFKVDYSTVSQNRRRMGIRLKEDQELRRAFEKVQERLDRLSKQKI